MSKNFNHKTSRILCRIWFIGMLLALIMSGCRNRAETQALVDKAVVMFGGEPREVRMLRKEAVEESDGIHQEYYFRQLNEEEKQVYRELLAGVQKFQNEILLTSADDAVIERAYSALLQDHSELFWIHGRGVVYKTLYSSYGKFQPKYGYTKEDADAITAEMEAKAKEVTAGIDSGASAYEKARYVYGYVIQNTVYQEGIHDQNLVGVMKEKAAVCAGYARTVQYLLEKLGVECIYVSGDMKGSNQGHAWNLVNLEGEYYYLDATNGDQKDFLPAPEGEPQRVIYDYLCPFPREYEAICQPRQEFRIPGCTAVQFNSYVQQGNCYDIYDREAVRSYFTGQVEEENSVFSVKFSRREDFETAREEWINQEEIQSVALYYLEWNGMEHIQYSYGILEDLNTLYFMF